MDVLHIAKVIQKYYDRYNIQIIHSYHWKDDQDGKLAVLKYEFYLHNQLDYNDL